MRRLLLMTWLLIAGNAFAAADTSPPAPVAAGTAAAHLSGEAATNAAIALLKTGSMNFDVAWSGIGLGDATIGLSATGEKGCYRYESQTRPIGVVRWLYGSPREISLFCIKDGMIRPSHYEYRIEQRPDDSFTLDFDWKAHTVKSIKGGQITVRDLPEVAYDRFGLQQAIRLWVMQQSDTNKHAEAEFVTVDAKDINHYRFAILGHEQVETPSGVIDTIRVDRIDSPTRSTRSWVAPSRDWHVVKVESLNRGKVELRMTVNK